MSRTASRPANPAPTARSTERTPDTLPFSPRPYFFIRPFPTLPDQWQSPQAQAKLLDEYLKHDGHFATFAAQRQLSVDQLYDWLNSEQVLTMRKRLETMAQERAELLARLARPAAIEALLNLLHRGCMNDNQLRLAASSLLRAAESADRRAEKKARDESKTVPPTVGSSNGRCSPAPRVTIPVPLVSGSSAGQCDDSQASATFSPRVQAVPPRPAPAASNMAPSAEPGAGADKPLSAAYARNTPNRAKSPQILARIRPVRPLALPAANSAPSSLRTPSRIPLGSTAKGHSHPNGARSIQRYEPRRA